MTNSPHCRQAKTLQANLMSICDRVEYIKSEHEKLEGENKFLQKYALHIIAMVHEQIS